MKNSGSRCTTRHLSGVTAAGVRSNVYDNTLLLPAHLEQGKTNPLLITPGPRIREPSGAPAAPATAPEASGRGRGTAAGGLGGGRGGNPGERGHRSDAPDRGTRDRAEHRRTWT